MIERPGGHFLTGDAFLALPQKQRKWLIRPLLPAGGIINLYGKPKTGKSFASLGMALAIANPAITEWNGFPIETHGPVAILQIDTPEGEMYDRILSVKEAGFDVSNVFFADMTIAPHPFNILQPSHQSWLRNQLGVIKPVFTLVDTLAESHEVDENKTSDMKRVVAGLVAASMPSAVGLISHSRKDSQFEKMGGESDLMDEGRGSSYIPGRMDTVIRFTGKGEPVKGTMSYKGRSKGASGKMKYVQDPDTGLVLREDSESKLEQLVLQVLREQPSVSIRQQALWLVKEMKTISESTARRRIEKHLKLLKTDPVVDTEPASDEN